MLTASINHLLNPLYDKHVVYIHNLSHFDGIFLLPVISKLQDKTLKLSVIKRDNNLINIRVKFGKNTINIRDSYLLLPSSLAKLAKSFGVLEKGIFPYNFVSANNLEYIGETPGFK